MKTENMNNNTTTRGNPRLHQATCLHHQAGNKLWGDGGQEYSHSPQHPSHWRRQRQAI